MWRGIIPGATGFIGSRFAQECVENGIEVILLVRDKSRLSPELVGHPAVHAVEGTVESAVPDMFGTGGFDAFYHFGWSGVAPEEKMTLIFR